MYKSTWYNDSGALTRQFICHHLQPDKLGRLDVPLAFGDGLTSCTYLEWIRDRAKRLFLILTDLCIPDQIFRLIDEGWEDDDLPIAQDQVGRLCLASSRDPKLEREFHTRQFFYLLRTLERDKHLDYEDHELVPLDVVERRPSAGSSQDAVQLPNLPLGELLCRRRVPLGPGAGRMSEDEFMWEISSIKGLQHPHMTCYWGSYTHQGNGYLLLAPAGEYKLSAYLGNSAPPAVKNLDGPVRRRMVLNWIHCMVSTLCFVHARGMALGNNIKPSTIAITRNQQVVFTGPLSSSRLASVDEVAGLHHHHHGFDREAYNYAAPERWARQGAPAAAGAPRGRAPWSTSTGADRDGVGGDEEHKFSISRGPPAPNTPPEPPPTPQLSNSHSSDSDPQQAADVFALGCIILELLGHGLLKRSASSFAAARAARHKSAGRGGAVPDASFHRNLRQVEAWMASLARDAAGRNTAEKKKKKKKNSATSEGEKALALACVYPILRAVERMLAANPADRPSAVQVRGWWARRVAPQAGGVVGEPHCAWRWDERLGSGVAAAGDDYGDNYNGDGNAPKSRSRNGSGGKLSKSDSVARQARTLACNQSFLLDAEGFSSGEERETDVTIGMTMGSDVVSRRSAPSLRSKRSASVGSGGVGGGPLYGSHEDRGREWWKPFAKGSMPMATSMQNLHISSKPKGKLWSSSDRSIADSAVSTGS